MMTVGRKYLVVAGNKNYSFCPGAHCQGAGWSGVKECSVKVQQEKNQEVQVLGFRVYHNSLQANSNQQKKVFACKYLS